MRARRLLWLVLPALLIGPASTRLVLAQTPPAGGPASARLEIPKGEFTVGDPIELKLTVTHPPGAVFDYPDVAGAFGRAQTPAADGTEAKGTGPSGVATLLVEEVKPFEGAGSVPGQTAWTIRLRVFSPGPHELPAITLAYRPAGAAEPVQVSTEPVTITVASVLKDKEESAADIKGQWLLPRRWLPWLIGGLAALALLALLLYLRRRLKKKPPAVPSPVVAPVAPVEHPYDRALRELAGLLAGRLLAEGRIKEFHVALSEIVKRFLGSLHGFDALDRTTEEVMDDLRTKALPRGLIEETGQFLAAADLVKFAKHHPERAEIESTVAAARRIIETGRPAPVAAGSGVAA